MIRCLMLLGLLLAGSVVAPAGEDPQIEVRQLVGQLDAPQLAVREAAEVALLGRGPAVLELLPPDSAPLSAEARQRLGRIRQRLQQAAADQTAKASTITLRAAAMPLAEILGEFEKQSGNTLIDYRRQFSQPASNPKLAVKFDDTPFWPALDQLLDQAGLTLYPFARPRALGVVAAVDHNRLARVGRASYSGPIRFEPVSVVARRDLRQTDGRSLVVTLEVAWEPRVRIISLVQRMADVSALDERGNPLPVSDRGAQVEVPIGGEAPAVKLDLPLRLPPREVRRIASLKGQVLATLAGRIECFRFNNLPNAKNLQQRIAGATVTLEHVRADHKAATDGRATNYEVRMRLRFDEPGDALASHRQWVFDNKAYLEGADGKPIAYDGFDTTAQVRDEVGLTYRFTIERPLAELTFVYKTPTAIITSSFEYELKDIELP